MAKTWRCAVVGSGLAGGWHVQLLPGLENTQLVAVCDVDPAHARAAIESAKAPNTPIYTSLDEMLGKEKIDILHVGTPSGDHFTPARMALERGINVITEKPMEITLERIDQMDEIAKKNGVRIAGIFQNRWNVANRAMHDARQQGRFGRIAWAGCFTPWYRPDKYYQEVPWRGTWALDGGAAIMNQSVHAIDLLQWIVGPVKRVSAYSSSRIHPKIEAEDTGCCALEFANGGYGTIMGTTAMFPGGPVRIEIGGENGTAVSEGGLRVFKFRDERPEDAQLLEQFVPPMPDIWKKRLAAASGQALMERLGLNAAVSTAGGASNKDVKIDLHIKNVRHILECWEAGRDAETNPAEARKSVAIVLAFYESSRRGGDAVDVK
jgi:predicted dehydrogenase